jgi:anthranilate synthase component 1
MMMKLITYERKLSGDTETPISIYSKYVKDQVGFLLESKEQPKGRYSFMAADPYMQIRVYNNRIETQMNGVQEVVHGRGLDLIEKMMDGIQVTNTTALPFIGGAVGTVGYDMIRDYENLPDKNPDTIGTPDSHLLFVKELIAYDHYYHQIHLICLDTDDDAGQKKSQQRFDAMEAMLHESLELSKTCEPLDVEFTTNMSQEAYMLAVEKAKQYIYDGDIFQVVLSQRLSGKGKDIDTFNLYRKLRQVNPSPYLYYFNMEDYAIVGSSPEMLVSIKDDQILTCPIAGTRKLGQTEEENEALAKDLLADKKERAEHMMLVDLGRNDMGKVSEFDSVKVESLMEVHQYSHVMHLVSLVSGKRRQGMSMFDVLMSFLPAGTLSGAPKIRAMEIIDELENKRRGIYGGAIGYFGFNKNMDMCIAIRTMVIKDDTIHIQAGAGIVADSDPEKEYEETINKAKALVTAIGR